jgi:Skp family chaperone for outer membrane proteins
MKTMTRTMMRRGAMKSVFCLLAAAVLALAPVTAHAADKADKAAVSAMKIATVDFQQLMTQSKAGKSLQKQLSTQQAALQADIDKAEQALAAEQKSLEESRSKLSAEEFSNKRTNFQKKLLENKNELENRKRALVDSGESAVSDLRKQITEIVYNIAKSKGIDLVLTRQNVVVASESIDITEAALAELDKKISEIKINKADSKG